MKYKHDRTVLYRVLRSVTLFGKCFRRSPMGFAFRPFNCYFYWHLRAMIVMKLPLKSEWTWSYPIFQEIFREIEGHLWNISPMEFVPIICRFYSHLRAMIAKLRNSHWNLNRNEVIQCSGKYRGKLKDIYNTEQSTWGKWRGILPDINSRSKKAKEFLRRISVYKAKEPNKTNEVPSTYEVPIQEVQCTPFTRFRNRLSETQLPKVHLLRL